MAYERATTLLFYILVSSAVIADEREIQLFGDGLDSCGIWLENRQSGDVYSHINRSWVEGFVTAYAYLGVQNDIYMDKVDSQSISAYIDNYCRQNPLDSVFQASISLVRELSE